MKRVHAVLLALAMVLTLAACGGDKPIEKTPDNEVESVTLNVVTSYGGDDGHRKDYEAAVDAYEAATGNTVMDSSGTANEEWKAKVLVDFETGSEPDVLFYFTGVDADPIINAGKVVSIQEIRREFPDYAANMLDDRMPVANDGKNYAVPSYGFWENMFVNVNVLEACNIPIPGPDYTWEQFLTDCQIIKDMGYTPIACSLFEVPHYWFEFAVMNNGTLDSQLEVPASAEDTAGQKWVAALNDLKDLYERGFFPENTLTATDAEAVAMFGESEAAFLVDGSWKVGYFSENYPNELEDFSVAYVPAKGERKASEAIGGISMGYFITKKAWENPAKRAAAVEFVEMMTDEETLTNFVTTEVTALKNGAVPSDLNALQQSAAQVNSGVTGYVGAVQDIITGESKESLFTNIQNVVTGNMSAEEAVAAAIALN